MVTWVVAQEYLKVTPRDLTVNMMKIDFLNESHGSPWELLVKNQTSSKPMGQSTWDTYLACRKHSGNFFNSALLEFL